MKPPGMGCVEGSPAGVGRKRETGRVRRQVGDEEVSCVRRRRKRRNVDLGQKGL